MKKNFLVCFILILFYITSCSLIQQPTIIQRENKVETQPKSEEPVQEKPKEEISAEVKELLSRHKTKVSNIYYKYRGPETGANFYEFYLKGNKIKYKPYLETKTLDQPDSFDSIFIDKTTKIAQSYCIAAFCKFKGKKADLSYADAYIPTIFDWIDVTEAKKVGEGLIDNRNTWKLETDKGILWVDTFYGIPLKVEFSGKTYKFEQISVDSVNDEDVVPS